MNFKKILILSILVQQTTIQFVEGKPVHSVENCKTKRSLESLPRSRRDNIWWNKNFNRSKYGHSQQPLTQSERIS